MQRLIELTANADLFSLRNLATRTMCLYLMQNAHGLIKIGRSADPLQRVAEVQKAARCPIRLVASFPDAGHFEEWVHLQMAPHHAEQEWFFGTERMRSELGALLGMNFLWPYDHQPEACATWIERLQDVATDRYWRRRERDVLRRIKGAVTGAGIFAAHAQGSVDLDGYVAPHVGYRDPVCQSSRHGVDVILARRDDSQDLSEVPAYTRSLDAASSLWLPESMPRAPQGDTRAVAVCFAALCDRLSIDSERLKPY